MSPFSQGYYNVKMLLFRPFLSHFTRKLRHTPTELEETINKCLESARKTIEVIHDIYRVHTFFRCWYVPPPPTIGSNYAMS